MSLPAAIRSPALTVAFLCGIALNAYAQDAAPASDGAKPVPAPAAATAPDAQAESHKVAATEEKLVHLQAAEPQVDNEVPGTRSQRTGTSAATILLATGFTAGLVGSAMILGGRYGVPCPPKGSDLLSGLESCFGQIFLEAGGGIFIGAGVTLIIISAVEYSKSSRDPPRRGMALLTHGVQPYVSLSGGGLSWSLRF